MLLERVVVGMMHADADAAIISRLNWIPERMSLEKS